MITHEVRVHRSDQNLAREEQLAWRIAEVAADEVAVSGDVAAMVINRMIDNAAVAAAALLRAPVTAARAQARRHPMAPGATVFGLSRNECVSPEWAAWANAVAVRELDYHDTFLAAEYSHPGDNIAPLLAVAQHVGERRHLDGGDLLRAIATGYEIQIDLARAISLHEHKIDHVAHLGPSVAAGLGTLLGLDVETTYQAIGQALHTTTATRQSRKGEISTWKAYAPAFAGKAAIEAVDRAMRGQTSPTPIYEGEDGVIAWMLDGPGAAYHVALPGPGEHKHAILESYTKEHSAEYQAQAWIDLARRLHAQHPELLDGRRIASVVIHSSYHTHYVIGSGAQDPQKYDPSASRETLDHSLPYIFTVAFQDGRWDHEASYAPARAHRDDTVALWRKVTTVEDPEWSRRYLSNDPQEKAFGGWVEIHLEDGTTLVDEITVPDAHPLGARPFTRSDYVHKFRTLAAEVVKEDEVERFLDAVQNLPSLSASELSHLSFRARRRSLESVVEPEGLF